MIKSRNLRGIVLHGNAATNGVTAVTTQMGAYPFSVPGIIRKVCISLPLKPAYNAGTYTTVTVRKNGATFLTGTNAGRSTASTSATNDFIEFDADSLEISKGSGFATGTRVDSTKMTVQPGDWFDFTVQMDGTQTTAGNFSVAVHLDGATN